MTRTDMYVEIKNIILVILTKIQSTRMHTTNSATGDIKQKDGYARHHLVWGSSVTIWCGAVHSLDPCRETDAIAWAKLACDIQLDFVFVCYFNVSEGGVG